MSAVQITDHQGNKVSHGRVLVNGVRLHYVTAGSGAPLLLLHGVPKTSFYWYRIIPLLTPHFTIVAPDIRGFGDSAKPMADTRPFNGRQTNSKYRSLLSVVSTS